jgi:cytochrome b
MNNTKTAIKVWDLPIRLFHWSLVLLLIFQWVTTQDDILYNMTWHMYGGYALLCLLLFRLLRGFWGSQHARFSDFFYGPTATLHYLTTVFKRAPSHYLGHNPMGAYSVFALLLLLGVQSVTGLFADDDIFTEGPLAGWVSNDTSDLMTRLHHFNFNLLLVFIGLHLAAIAFYALFKRENLVRAMITGRKTLDSEAVTLAPPAKHAPLWLAIGLLAIACAIVLTIVLLLPKWL